MSKLKKIINKRNLKIVSSLFLALCTTLTILLCYISKDIVKVSIEYPNNDGYINRIFIGRTEYPLEAFDNKNTIIYDGEELKIKQNYELVIEHSRILNATIGFVSEPGTTLHLTINGETDVRTFEKDYVEYHYSESIRAVLTELIITSPVKTSLFSIIILIISFIIFYIFMSYIERFLDLAKEDKLKLRNIISFSVIMFLIFLSSYYLLLQIFSFLTILPIIIFLIYCLYTMKENVKEKYPQIFLIISLTLGIYMLFCLPVLHVPDEQGHVLQAYSIFHKTETDKTGQDVVLWPQNVSNMVNKYTMDIHNPAFELTAKNFFTDVNIIFDEKDDNLSNQFHESTQRLPILCYLAPGLIMLIALKLHIPFIIILLLMRFVSLLIFSLCGYKALKYTPKFKKVFMIMMLLPITIQQAAAVNQDSLSNSLFFLILALILNLIYNKKEEKDKYKIIVLIALGILLGFCKVGYFPILFLSVLIPASKFKYKKLNYISKIAIILPCILINSWTYLTLSEGFIKELYPISTLYTNPLRIAFVCLKTFVTRGPLDLITGLINGFGWSTVWHNQITEFIILIIILILLLTSNDKEDELEIKNRFMILIIGVLLLGFVYASLLFGWTPKGADTIWGLQSRYFIATTTLLTIGISNKILKLNTKNNDLIYPFGVIIVLGLSFFTIILAYYL